MTQFEFTYHNDKPYKYFLEDSLEDNKAKFFVHGKKRSVIDRVLHLKGFVPLNINGKNYHVTRESYNDFLDKFPILPLVEDVQNLQNVIDKLLLDVNQPTQADLHVLYQNQQTLEAKIKILGRKSIYYKQDSKSSDAILKVLSQQEILIKTLIDKEAIWKETLPWLGTNEEDLNLNSLFYKNFPPEAPKDTDTRLWSLERNLKRGMNTELFNSDPTSFGPSWTNYKVYDKSLRELTASVTDEEVKELYENLEGTLDHFTDKSREFLKNYIQNFDDRTPIVALRLLLDHPEFYDSAITICNAWALAKDYSSKITSVQMISIEEGKDLLIQSLQNHFFENLSFVYKHINNLKPDASIPQEKEAVLKEFSLNKAKKVVEAMLLESKDFTIARIKYNMKQDELSELFKRFKLINHNLFIPNGPDGAMESVIPCFAGTQSYLKALFGDDAILLAAVFGMSPIKEIWDDIFKGQHQTGINIPGVQPMTKPDNLNSLLNGFYLHDVYHAETASYVPKAHRYIFSRLLFITQAYFKDHPNTQLRDSLYNHIDMEHSNYRIKLNRFQIMNNREPTTKELNEIHADAFIETIKHNHRFEKSIVDSDLRKLIWNDRKNWIALGLTKEQLKLIIDSAEDNFFTENF
ncbi:MAG: hypothetical protein JHC93_06970 [Parachlamydiales bacterium]|nr:hypothetical protein [Parachlamydiales bacterium]